VNTSFNYLPLAALVGRDCFCVHGGITPQVTSLRQIRQISRPIETYDNSMIGDLMWSDPGFETKEYLRNERGNGVVFGVSAVKDFLKAVKVTKIIRAHQCVDSGVEQFGEDSVYTVFSCSNYQDASNNRCGLVYLDGDGELQAFSLPPVKQIPRQSALLCGPLQESASEGGGESQNSIRSTLMCMVRSDSIDSGFTKLRVNRKATAIGSAIRAQMSGNSSVLRRSASLEPNALPPL
jgi:protein phosphatase